MKFNALKQRIKLLPVFSTSMLSTISKDTASLKVQISGWKKKGLILQLRKGLYILNKDERDIEPSLFYLANQIFIPSYVSLEAALAYYGLIPEFVPATTSITTRKTCKFKNEFGVFTYQHVKPNNFGGFNAIQDQKTNLTILIASAEKAVIDFFYLNLSDFNVSKKLIFTKSYRFQNCSDLKSTKLLQYAKIFRSKKLLEITRLFISELVK